MKCDLCGKHINENEVYSYADVHDSELCSNCYEMVVSEKINESETGVATPEVVNTQDHKTNEPRKLTCYSCSSTFEEGSEFCPNCHQGSLRKSLNSSDIKILLLIFVLLAFVAQCSSHIRIIDG